LIKLGISIVQHTLDNRKQLMYIEGESHNWRVTMWGYKSKIKPWPHQKYALKRLWKMKSLFLG